MIKEFLILYFVFLGILCDAQIAPMNSLNDINLKTHRHEASMSDAIHFIYSLDSLTSQLDTLSYENPSFLDIIAATENKDYDQKYISQNLVLYVDDQHYLTSTIELAYPILLINHSDSAVGVINTMNGRLIMHAEALNENNEWKPIEYWSNSWCCDKYFCLTIPERHFILSQFRLSEGEFKTTARLVMNDGEIELISNEFSMSINPYQFNDTRKFIELR